MSESTAFRNHDDRFVLDDATVDAIIDGVAPDGVPDHYRLLAQAFSAVRHSGSTAPEHAEAAVVEMFRAVHPNPARPRRSPMNRKLSARALVLSGALTLVSAGAVAASGLPGAAQDTASAALAKIGITVPGANDHSADHPNARGASTKVEVAHASSESSDNEASVPSSLPQQAADIAAAATDTSLTGVDKGEAVSSLASGGKSHAGSEHRSADAHAGAAAAAHAGPPESVPAGPPADLPAGPPVSVPVGPPAGVPAGPPESVPAGPPADHPDGPPVSTPVGPPADHPVGPPVSTPDAEPPVSVPAGPPVSIPVTHPQHP